MDIQHKNQLREEALRRLYPQADDKIKKKTKSELGLNEYLIHYRFTRFAFAVLSFSLYLPTIIDWFIKSYNTLDYIRNIILVLILILLEVGLSYFLKEYFISKYSQNETKRFNKKLAFTLAAVSIILSSLSGVNAIEITDNGTETAIKTTRKEKKEDISIYKNMVVRNDKLISSNNATIRNNNLLIKDLSPIAATQKGSSQIASYQARNKEMQKQNTHLLKESQRIRQEIKKIRKDGDILMKERIGSAGKKELTYMIIFFVAGIVSVLGLFFSYNFIGQYNKHLTEDANNLEALQEQFEENLKKDIAVKTRKDKLEKLSKLDNIEIEKQLKDAEKRLNEEDDEEPYIRNNQRQTNGNNTIEQALNEKKKHNPII